MTLKSLRQMLSAKITTSKLKENAHWIVAALVSLAAIVAAVCVSNRVETEARSTYESYADSIATLRHSDSAAFNEEITRLQIDLLCVTTERDSIDRKLSTQTSTTKVVYRTVYKDSVREVTVENSETASVYEERIAQVRDSLTKIIAEKDDVEIQYVDRVVHDTVVQYNTRTDSVVTVSTVEKKDGPIGLYASGQAGYGTDGFTYGVDAGMKYYFLGPVYGKAGVEYDGAVSGIIGVGIDIRF